MPVPDHLCHYPTAIARASLATRLGIAVNEVDQDWEWTVADPERLDEYIALYGSGGLSDDERFSLMEMILQACDDSDQDAEQRGRWGEVLGLLRQNVELHAHTIVYWASSEGEPWRYSIDLRAIVTDFPDVFTVPS